MTGPPDGLSGRNDAVRRECDPIKAGKHRIGICRTLVQPGRTRAPQQHLFIRQQRPSTDELLCNRFR